MIINGAWLIGVQRSLVLVKSQEIAAQECWMWLTVNSSVHSDHFFVARTRSLAGVYRAIFERNHPATEDTVSGVTFVARVSNIAGQSWTQVGRCELFVVRFRPIPSFAHLLLPQLWQ